MLSQAEAQADQAKLLNLAAEMNKVFGAALAIAAPHVNFPQVPEPQLPGQHQDLTELEGYFSRYTQYAKDLETYFISTQQKLGVNPKTALQMEIEELQEELRVKNELIANNLKKVAEWERSLASAQEELLDILAAPSL